MSTPNALLFASTLLDTNYRLVWSRRYDSLEEIHIKKEREERVARIEDFDEQGHTPLLTAVDLSQLSQQCDHRLFTFANNANGHMLHLHICRSVTTPYRPWAASCGTTPILRLRTRTFDGA